METHFCLRASPIRPIKEVKDGRERESPLAVSPPVVRAWVMSVLKRPASFAAREQEAKSLSLDG
jgi:hypothetical protein